MRPLWLKTEGVAEIWFGDNNTVRWYINSVGGGHFEPSVSNQNDLGSSTKRVRSLYLGQFLEAEEMTAPAAPSSNRVRLYAEDNGSGKTRLMALFATGAAQQIAIEP